MKILFIQTGGTIDKDYPKSVKGYAFEIGEPAVKRILEKIKPSFDYEILPLIKKDSIELTEDDRRKLYEVCANADANKIIITHGTDTIIETAEYISGIRNKTIILTGAFKPERFKDSDAEFNVGAATGAVSPLGPGVYVCMNGRISLWNKVKRDKEGKFIHED